MKQYNGEKAIISLTSWKARINTVCYTLFSLVKQCPGFHIVLVLSEEEFPKKEAELPERLMDFVNGNLIELLWVYKNYKAFKKVLFTMDKYRDVPVISADDDCIYTCNYAETLYNEWLKHQSCIITNDGMSAHKYGIQWGRGPNTLYPPAFNGNISDILELVNGMHHYAEDDSFYGLIALCNNIQYIDLLQKSFYVFHTSEHALHNMIDRTIVYLAEYKTMLTNHYQLERLRHLDQI